MDLTKKKFVVMGLSPSGLAISIGHEVVRRGGELIYTVESDRLLRIMMRKGFSDEEKVHLDLDGVSVFPCDVERHEDIEAFHNQLLVAEVRIDGLVHCMAFADKDTMLGETLFNAGQGDVAKSFDISASSLVHIMARMKNLMNNPASVVAMTFESQKVMPRYTWMHMCKAALEAAVRVLADELGKDGIRVNAVSAGPLDTMSAKAIPDFDKVLGPWDARSPLGWDFQKGRKWVAQAACDLLGSFEGMTGQVLKIDGGCNITMFVD